MRFSSADITFLLSRPPIILLKDTTVGESDGQSTTVGRQWATVLDSGPQLGSSWATAGDSNGQRATVGRQWATVLDSGPQLGGSWATAGDSDGQGATVGRQWVTVLDSGPQLSGYHEHAMYAEDTCVCAYYKVTLRYIKSSLRIR